MESAYSLPSVTRQFGRFTLGVPELTIERSEILGIFGRSGSGKSTYLRGLFEHLSEHAQLLPQEDDVLSDLTTRQNVFLGVWMGSRGHAAHRTYGRLVDHLDLIPLEERRASTLSGGQRRRAALARVIGATPKILLLDEPFNGLGRFYESRIASLLEERTRAGLITVVVSHDLDLLLRSTSRVVVLHNGRHVDTLSHGLPARGWSKELAEVLGAPNLFQLGDLRTIGRLGGPLSSLDAAKWIMAWKPGAVWNTPDEGDLSIDLSTANLTRALHFTNEGVHYLQVAVLGPNGSLELVGRVLSRIDDASSCRRLVFTAAVAFDDALG